MLKSPVIILYCMCLFLLSVLLVFASHILQLYCLVHTQTNSNFNRNMMNYLLSIFFFFFNVLAAQHSMWDLSSPTRD